MHSQDVDPFISISRFLLLISVLPNRRIIAFYGKRK